jgi:hydroxycarboxylate dehydrogenase B
MPRLSAEQLRGVATGILAAVGTPPDIAARVSEILVNADLAGHSSHGVARLPSYLEEVAEKKVAVGERPQVLRETAATAVLDARRGWGHFAADRGMQIAIDKARQTGVGAVTMGRCPHVGRLGEYVEMAAAAGCIGLATLGYGGRNLGWSAPYGGRDKMLMTNPIAIGVPSAAGAPFLLDFATTTASRGKIKVAQAKGESLPEGWILDGEGRASTNPEDFAAGGFLTFAGAHKGYALCLAACLLGGLSGGFQAEHARMGGVYLQAMQIDAFLPAASHGGNSDQFLAAIRNSRPVDGDRPVLVPGDLEAQSRDRQRRDGIDVSDKIWRGIEALTRKYQIEPVV